MTPYWRPSLRPPSAPAPAWYVTVSPVSRPCQAPRSMVLLLVLTDAGAKLPSAVGVGFAPCSALMVSVSPALITDAAATPALTFGVALALAWSVVTDTAPPPTLREDASASVVESACTVMLPLALLWPPTVASTFGAAFASTVEEPTLIAPPVVAL